MAHKSFHSGLPMSTFDLERTSRQGWVATMLARENEASRRAVGEQSAFGIGDAALCCADTPAAAEDVALGPDLARL